MEICGGICGDLGWDLSKSANPDVPTARIPPAALGTQWPTHQPFKDLELFQTYCGAL